MLSVSILLYFNSITFMVTGVVLTDNVKNFCQNNIRQEFSFYKNKFLLARLASR